MQHQRKAGFTIVELLIVIVVIAIIAAISIIAYRGITQRSVETALKSDLRDAGVKVALSKAETGSYPTDEDEALSLFIPSAGTSYQYTSDDGSSYYLTITSEKEGVSAFCQSSDGTVTEGVCPGHTAPSGGGSVASQPSSCPTGFIPVPGNSHYGTDGGFCVMKYEAKNVGGTATSQASGFPWGNINQVNARTSASNACSGCKLINDPEWMTIATNVISVPSNWVSGTVGVGMMYRGHTDTAPASPRTASSNDSDGYFDTSNTDGSEQRRTLTLTNGEVIWDFAGNVSEWTDATIAGGKPGSGENMFAYIWMDYNDSSLQWNSFPVTSRPTGTLYSRSQGVGGLYSNAENSVAHGFRRGGGQGNGSYAGVLALWLNSTPTSTDVKVGFRATK